MNYNVITHNKAARLANDLRDFFSLASTPNDEECTQAGGSMKLQIIECTAYINQLKRENGKEPEGAEFFIIENYHEFGTYYEAGIWFEPTKPEAEETSISEEYANRCEIGPDKWDNQALTELRKSNHPNYQPAKVINIKAA